MQIESVDEEDLIGISSVVAVYMTSSYKLNKYYKETDRNVMITIYLAHEEWVLFFFVIL